MSRGVRRTLAGLLGFVGLVAVLTWAAVPFYHWFRVAAGLSGAMSTATVAPAPQEILERTVKIRFDASQGEGVPLEFRPLQRTMRLRIGETALGFFEVTNPTDRTIAARFTHNVSPFQAGGFVGQIDCFCTATQVLAPGETAELPVNFFVDPAIADDADGKYVKMITLSYTIYETDLPAAQARLAGDNENQFN